MPDPSIDNGKYSPGKKHLANGSNVCLIQRSHRQFQKIFATTIMENRHQDKYVELDQEPLTKIFWRRTRG